MDRVRVRIDDFESGNLPDICVATGRPAQGLSSAVARRTEPWALAGPLVGLLLFGPPGLLAGLVILAVAGRSARGWLPWSHHVSQVSMSARGTALRWATLTGLAVVALLGAAALLNLSGLALTAIAAGLPVFAALLLRAASPPGAVKVRLDTLGRWVEMRGVAPAFVWAYEEQSAGGLSRRNQVPS